MTESVQARLRAGLLTGLRDENGICRFSAIPYAAPPLGALRFAPPEPARWEGPRDATRPGPVPPQLPSRLRGAMGDFDAPQSEDCLHLTVWTPAADARRRPVVVWLHGGAWQSGAGALDWYDGARLAGRGDVVVVAVNYRLAALGWLHVPGQTANVGLLDQEAAIDWVMDNIDAMGGDPERVTLMGQSAGASSICAMLTRRPRFARAILQSAALGRGFRSSVQAAALGKVFLEAAGAATLQAARALPVEHLLAAQQAPQVVAALQAEGGRRSLFGPVLDGQVLPADIAPALQRAAGRADVLVAYTRNEMAAFPGYGTGPDSQAASEAVFGAPSRQWATDAVAQGRQAWLARVDVAPTEVFLACHCIELPFVFGTLDAFDSAPMLRGLPSAQAARLTETTQRAWLAFIRGETPDWPPAPHLHALD
ncbi:Para-nitrobenzyl esterase [Achromobacter deleyi]|uniref:Para-nitrobenzyl esterase n=1 Tax=Achromobacter deleyi TaxID=1353891 RepID=A0A6S7ALA5_9BURK|nr:carboxylesterase family protein [Achromobacter deleyi]CAB3737571.1 Para-nitrobenzyl esterase [Achromobacter deleyi]CAB3904144.1 Para-nitrobenzyl esterase [Achromobacter deleyi]CAB3923139.1 Para-nitrobenzyl esterase [Achromobacter deleyi]